MAFKKGIKQGFYEPVYPEKWIITESFDTKGAAIKYRSSWEHRFMIFADMNPDIVRVNSEGIKIPYISPVDNKVHRYYMDFYIENKKGTRYLVEVKPLSQTTMPKPPKSKTEKSLNNFKKAIMTFAVNKAKWEAAEAYAAENGMKFIIITERELGL